MRSDSILGNRTTKSGFVHSARARTGFSLLELVIVIVILGIIAAIAVPRMSRGADGAIEVRLSEDQRRLQAACELYTVERGGVSPAVGLDTSIASTATLVGRLVGRTDAAGSVSLTGEFGPYLRTMPLNAKNGRRSIRVGGPAAGANTHGWRLDPVTGAVEADHGVGVVVRAADNDTLEAAVGTALGAARDGLGKAGVE